ncbi:ATP-binding protein [Niallia endozanthoxylica]|uniref:histidine kinase n=1 Tax=Niallia endozanthoxylica TaxID=2036016 RepID=A0A5J5HMK4_9BACI|nr:ATP-binding protein [Niallia endozanthoxylica]KAA9021626.1 two-component sensor histidine kinase [Niallia endozanthoxylica]
MDLVTKDLLINFLFILLVLCLMQILYMIKYTYRLEHVRDWTLSLFPIMSLILCMIFPVYTNEHFIWDLRWIPFVLGGLYGGYKLGYLLIILTLVIRYIQGGDGFYPTMITFTIMGFVIIYLSKFYSKLQLRQKVGLNIFLTFVGLSFTQLLSNILFNYKFTIEFWLVLAVIHIIGMAITTFLWEGIKMNFQVLQKLIKAEKLQTVSHLAASISHEVRNPLTAARGFIQLLSNDIPDDTRKLYSDIALKELDRATEVINDYLTFAKPAPDREEIININEEIQHAVNVVIPLATMNSVEIQLSLLDEEYFTKGERKKFQQCLINILKNGIESMKTNGELTISQSFKDDHIKIDIQDEGVGMTQEQINRLGEPYFTTKEKGTGLGMMVSYSIIKSMRGTIYVNSEYGEGTCFTLILPIFQNKSYSA